MSCEIAAILRESARAFPIRSEERLDLLAAGGRRAEKEMVRCNGHSDRAETRLHSRTRMERSAGRLEAGLSKIHSFWDAGVNFGISLILEEKGEGEG